MSDKQKPKLYPDKHWSISVSIDGEQVVSIEPDMVSGRDLTQDEHVAACRAVHNLWAFLGCVEWLPE